MKKYGKFGLGIIFIFMSVSCIKANIKVSSPPVSLKEVKIEPEIKDPAPDFKLISVSGETYNLSDYRGKQAVMLFFWTTWCPYCRKEINNLTQKSQDLPKKNVEILCINVGEPEQRIEVFLKTNNIAFPVLLDEDSSVGRSFGLLGVPTYIFINKKGSIIFKKNYLSDEDLERWINA